MSDFQRPHCRSREACAAKSPVTHCRQCANLVRNADPAVREKTSAAMKRRMADPAFKARLIGGAVAARIERLRNDPEFAERMRQHGRDHYHRVLNRPDVRERNRSPEARARAGRAHSDRDMAWCPREFRPMYFGLSRTMTAAERRAVVQQHIEQEAKRAIARVAGDMRAKEARRRREAY